jgi:hypothetical protein
MGKSRRNRSSRRKSSKRGLPIIGESLGSIGYVAKKATTKSIPVIEKGVSAVYGTFNKGLDLGVKGVKNISGMSRSRRTRRYRKK